MPPVVSCIMPTADRRDLVPRALLYFERQEFADRELVIVDDGADRVRDLIPPDDERIRYFEVAPGLTLGEKRNRACELADGALVAHWDDDDWVAPRRLGYQVRALEQSGAALCGLRRQPFIDFAGRRAWCYEYPAAQRQWVSGSSLCYRRELWERLRFPAVNEGEDTCFMLAPDGANALVLDDSGILVELLHARNTSARPNRGPRWRARPFEEVVALLGPDAAFYDAWAAGHAVPRA